MEGGTVLFSVLPTRMACLCVCVCRSILPHVVDMNNRPVYIYIYAHTLKCMIIVSNAVVGVFAMGFAVTPKEDFYSWLLH